MNPSHSAPAPDLDGPVHPAERTSRFGGRRGWIAGAIVLAAILLWSLLRNRGAGSRLSA